MNEDLEENTQKQNNLKGSVRRRFSENMWKEVQVQQGLHNKCLNQPSSIEVRH